jgi:hypothetical protein
VLKGVYYFVLTLLLVLLLVLLLLLLLLLLLPLLSILILCHVCLQDADLVLVEYSLNGCRDSTGRALCSSAVMPRVRLARHMVST